MDNHSIASIVRALSERVDPGRVLRDVVKAAVETTQSGHGVVAGAVDGEITPLVVAGVLHPVLLVAARRAVATRERAHASDPQAGLDAWAVPILDGSSVTAALVVAAPPRTFDPSDLAVWADCAALAMNATGRAASVPPPGRAALDLAERLASIAAEPTPHGVLRRALEVAELSFGLRAGFAALVDGSSVEISYYVGIRRERLADAVLHPSFPEMVTGSAVTVRPPTDGVVVRLAEGAELALCLPVPGGAVVFLTGDTPDVELARALEAFRRQVAGALRGALATASLDRAGGDVAAMVHAMPEPVLAVDGTGRFMAFNAAAAELFALAEPFEVGRPARSRLGHPELEALLLGERTADLDVTLGRPSPSRWRAYSRRVGSGRALVLREIRTSRALDGDVERVVAMEDQLTGLGDGDELVLRPELCDVVALARDLAAEAELGRPGRTVSVVAHPQRIDAKVDRGALSCALRPLLDNALSYSEGPVGVEVADRGDAFEIAVVDAGPGIYSGDVPGLFERAHTLDGSPEAPGSGPGLYTARRLVEAMDGRIWCDSRLGLGSRFAFRLRY